LSQELCVSILPTFANMVDYSSMKHSIVPRMTALCIQAGTTSVSYMCVRSMPKTDYYRLTNRRAALGI